MSFKNDFAKKSYDEFAVLHITSAKSRKQVQNVAKLVTLYRKKVPSKNRVTDSCLKAPLTISAYVMYIY